MTPVTGDLGVLNVSPLGELGELLRTRDASRDLVDADVAAAVARAREAGVPWGQIATVLRGR